MEEYWKKEYKSSGVKTPKKIVESICKQLSKNTSGRVLAKIELFDKTLKEMNKGSYFSQLPIAVLSKQEMAQDKLGEVGDSSKFTFEVYLTGEKTNNYKYRMLFLEYGAVNYPVRISLDRMIAEELKCGYEVSCKNETELKEMIKSIVTTDTVTDIIEGLLGVN